MQQKIVESGQCLRRRRQLLPWLAGFVLLISTSGCLSLPQERVKDTLFDRGGIDAILATSDRQPLIIKDPASLERLCLGPGPDYSITASRGVDVDMTAGLPIGPKGDQHVGGGVSRGALSLGGRNPGVLIARELLYRACELSMNVNADSATTISIFTRVLESIEKIALSETGTGSASVASTPLQPPPDLGPGQQSSPNAPPSGGAGIPGVPPAQPGGPVAPTP